MLPKPRCVLPKGVFFHGDMRWRALKDDYFVTHNTTIPLQEPRYSVLYHYAIIQQTCIASLIVKSLVKDILPLFNSGVLVLCFVYI